MDERLKLNYCTRPTMALKTFGPSFIVHTNFIWFNDITLYFMFICITPFAPHFISFSFSFHFIRTCSPACSLALGKWNVNQFCKINRPSFRMQSSRAKIASSFHIIERTISLHTLTCTQCFSHHRHHRRRRRHQHHHLLYLISLMNNVIIKKVCHKLRLLLK